MRSSPTIYIYLASFEACLSTNFFEKYAALLSAEEITRRERFVTPTLRDRFLVSHALLRCALSRHAKVAPGDWKFSRSIHGKPFVCETHGNAAGLRFNLSHDDHLAAVAICEGREIGVDVEPLARNTELFDSSLVLCRSERRFLQSLPREYHAKCFLEHWTLKEAYLKARGTGLSTSLTDVELDLSRTGSIGISLAPTLADKPDNWAYFQYRLEPNTIMSLCAERKHREEHMDVRISRLIPLHEAEPLPHALHRQG